MKIFFDDNLEAYYEDRWAPNGQWSYLGPRTMCALRDKIKKISLSVNLEETEFDYKQYQNIKKYKLTSNSQSDLAYFILLTSDGIEI